MITPAASSELVRRAAESVKGVRVRRSRRSVGIEPTPESDPVVDVTTEAVRS